MLTRIARTAVLTIAVLLGLSLLTVGGLVAAICLGAFGTCGPTTSSVSPATLAAVPARA